MQMADPVLRDEHSEIARVWRHLARSYEFVESLERFLHDKQKAQSLNKQKAKDAVLYLAAVCPSCRKQMRLIGSEPHERYRDLDLYRFICHCGHVAETYVARES
jgi:hypothetical protein